MKNFIIFSVTCFVFLFIAGGEAHASAESFPLKNLYPPTGGDSNMRCVEQSSDIQLTNGFNQPSHGRIYNPGQIVTIFPNSNLQVTDPSSNGSTSDSYCGYNNISPYYNYKIYYQMKLYKPDGSSQVLVCRDFCEVPADNAYVNTNYNGGRWVHAWGGYVSQDIPIPSNWPAGTDLKVGYVIRRAFSATQGGFYTMIQEREFYEHITIQSGGGGSTSPGTLNRSIPDCSNTNYNVVFTWTNPAGSGWYLDTSTSSSSFPAGQPIPVNTTSYTTGPFSTNTTYYWRIWNGSTHTNGPSFNVGNCAASEPTNLVVSKVQCSNTLYTAVFAWTGNAGSGWFLDLDTDNFNQPWQGQPINQGAGTLTWNDLSLNTTYYWRIYYNVPNQHAYPNPSTFRVDACDSSGPTNLQVQKPTCTSTGSYTATFTWNGATGSGGGVDLDVDNFNLPWSFQSASTGATDLTWSGLQANVTYYWRVWPGSGDHAYPNPPTFSVPQCSSPPPGIASGNISASPNPCTIPAGQSTCSSTITWDSTGANLSVVCAGSVEYYSGPSGSQNTANINSTGVTFYLRDGGCQSNTTILDQVFVRGVAAPPPVNSPPTGTITAGPTSVTANTTVSYSATVNDVNANLRSIDGIEIYVEGSPQGTQNWVRIGAANCSGSTCSASAPWTPTVPGTYTIVVNGYDSAGGQCTGNSYLNPLPAPWVRCSSSNQDFRQVTVSKPPDIELDPSTNVNTEFQFFTDAARTQPSSTFRSGETMYVRIKIQNTGATITTPFRVGFYLGQSTLSSPSCNQAPEPAGAFKTVGSIATNQVDTWDTLQLPAPSNGGTAYAFADYQCVIAETDRADNIQSKTYNIQVDSWFETVDGDVGAAQGTIGTNVLPPAVRYNSTYLLAGRGLNNNVISNRGWRLNNYQRPLVPVGGTYYFLAERYKPKAVPVPNCGIGGLATGLYVYAGNCQYNSGVPNGHVVMFIDGNLTIAGPLQIPSPNASITFIASGDITVKTGVRFADGVYITKGTFRDTDAASGEQGNQLQINGAVYANTVILTRKLGGTGCSVACDPSLDPAERIVADPKYMIGLNNILGTPALNWTETNP